MQVKQILTLMEKMKETGLSRLELSEDSFSLCLERREAEPASVPAATPPAVQAKSEAAAERSDAKKGGHLVTSPVVGIYYEAPSPDEKPFVSVGQTVEPGMTLCIIEAMKLMNEVTCERGGQITEILVENGQRVEFGQPLMRIGGDADAG